MSDAMILPFLTDKHSIPYRLGTRHSNTKMSSAVVAPATKGLRIASFLPAATEMIFELYVLCCVLSCCVVLLCCLCYRVCRAAVL